MIYKLKKLFFLKPRKDCEQKYQEIFMNVWSAEQKQELIHLVKQQMHENCYVDFNDISQMLYKTSDSCIQTYIELMDSRWTQQMDKMLTEYVYCSQEKPPFWSLIAFQLGVYELACVKRYQLLKLDQESAWSEEELDDLKNWWTQWRKEKFMSRQVSKEEIREILPHKQIWEVRKKLTETGCRLDRIQWK
ncbi:Conserved_hypothetical protein [Hexamita inflata]|uniref:Uncharacterized protein n=1 Tax=Hexamita inflata TaxID=28002 RepID=A0AA86U5I3_9EUKA|nr:Conserved hypothetical protein [Hexamita inflata]